MSWRSTQLNGQLCDQDKKILDLFGNDPVRYIGNDLEFAKYLNVQPTAPRIVLIFDRAQWLHNIVKQCQQYLTADIKEFYIGINRYSILGNNTDMILIGQGQAGSDIIRILEKIVNGCGFTVTDQGHFDNDQGRYFNFVQPLTWIYGHNATN